MPNDATAYNPQGVEIRFDEAAHTYETDNTTDFTSSSGIIHNFFPQFDAVEVSTRIAPRKGKTPEQLQEEWRLNAERACHYGTRCHLNMEGYLSNKPELINTPENPKEQASFQVCFNAAQWILNNYQVIQCEAILFSERFKIAGTTDILLWDAKTNELIIGDFKTNKEIKYSGFNGEKGFNPISHLENCNYNHYSLQLSVYEFLMVHGNYFPPETKYRRALIHISETEFSWVELPCRKQEVSDMILYHRTEGWDDIVPF